MKLANMRHFQEAALYGDSAFAHKAGIHVSGYENVLRPMNISGRSWSETRNAF